MCVILVLIAGLPNIHRQMGCDGLRGSEITLYGETSPIERTNERSHSRTKVKTNGHFTTFMQVRVEYSAIN